jgi:hypothetical protein
LGRRSGGVHHDAPAKQQAFGAEHVVDHAEHLIGQLVLFEQVAKAQDGGFVGQALCPVELRKLALYGGVV